MSLLTIPTLLILIGSCYSFHNNFQNIIGKEMKIISNLLNKNRLVRNGINRFNSRFELFSSSHDNLLSNNDLNRVKVKKILETNIEGQDILLQGWVLIKIIFLLL